MPAGAAGRALQRWDGGAAASEAPEGLEWEPKPRRERRRGGKAQGGASSAGRALFARSVPLGVPSRGARARGGITRRGTRPGWDQRHLRARVWVAHSSHGARMRCGSRTSAFSRAGAIRSSAARGAPRARVRNLASFYARRWRVSID